jgi:ribonuclease E
MPNTAHGGGISRKISNLADRRRLKSIMSELKLPQGMGAIVRTAGLKRSSADIRRDFEYLTRLWDEIREKTLASSAPALIHADSDLIKRAIRDIYHRDIDQVLVEGPQGFADASRFMSMLMPGHTPKVVEYVDNVPLFQRFGVEQQLEGMYQPVVQLKSGGYIVINPTEALVSIDINSGRSTREYGIEETATKTNLEAAEEIGRQLRLRDMAGLVVIDFIDMEVSANNRRVEKAMKDALRHDRARVQIGRISAFGLLEMSRQRLRTGILEASTHSCPMCEGTGMVRSVASAALAALRALEAEALRGRASEFTLRAGDEVAVYILNRKRIELAELEDLYGVMIVTVPDEALIGPNFAIDAVGPPPSKKVEMRTLPMPVRIEDDPDDYVPAEGDDEAEDRPQGERDERADRNGRGKRRRRGRERDDDARGDEAAPEALEPAATQARGEASDKVPVGADAVTEADEPGNAGAKPERGDRKRRRRGRRGKRDGARDNGAVETAPAPETAEVAEPVPSTQGDAEPTKPKRSRRRKADVEAVPDVARDVAFDAAEAAPMPAADAEASPEVVPAKAPRRRKAKPDAVPEAMAAVAAVAPPAIVAAVALPAIVTEAEAAVAKPRRARKPKAEAVEPAPVEEAEPARPPKPARGRARAAEAAATPAVEAPAAAAKPVADPVAVAVDEAPDGPPKRGWWQRTFG